MYAGSSTSSYRLRYAKSNPHFGSNLALPPLRDPHLRGRATNNEDASGSYKRALDVASNSVSQAAEKVDAHASTLNIAEQHERLMNSASQRRNWSDEERMLARQQVVEARRRLFRAKADLRNAEREMRIARESFEAYPKPGGALGRW